MEVKIGNVVKYRGKQGFFECTHKVSIDVSKPVRLVPLSPKGKALEPTHYWAAHPDCRIVCDTIEEFINRGNPMEVIEGSRVKIEGLKGFYYVLHIKDDVAEAYPVNAKDEVNWVVAPIKASLKICKSVGNTRSKYFAHLKDSQQPAGDPLGLHGKVVRPFEGAGEYLVKWEDGTYATYYAYSSTRTVDKDGNNLTLTDFSEVLADSLEEYWETLEKPKGTIPNHYLTSDPRFEGKVVKVKGRVLSYVVKSGSCYWINVEGVDADPTFTDPMEVAKVLADSAEEYLRSIGSPKANLTVKPKEAPKVIIESTPSSSQAVRYDECLHPVHEPLTIPKAPLVTWEMPEYPTEVPGEFINQNSNKEESNIMSNRRVVSVVLLDPSAGIEDADAIVADCGQHVMSGSQQELIQEILMDPKANIAGAIADHNKKRAGIVDLDILKRTGNEVKLQPVKIKDLQWDIK